MTDQFANYTPGMDDPAAYAATITPNDATDLASTTRGILVGTPGTLKVTTAGGSTVTIPSACLVAGMILPLRVTRVHSTGTTASNMVAFW